MVYGSHSPELSLAEALAATRALGIPDEQVLPRVTVAARASLARVLQLDHRARRSLGVKLEDLLERDWKRGRVELRSQALGRLAWTLGFECLQVPSAVTRRGLNLVIFPDNLRPSSHLEAWGVVSRDKPGSGPDPPARGPLGRLSV